MFTQKISIMKRLSQFSLIFLGIVLFLSACQKSNDSIPESFDSENTADMLFYLDDVEAQADEETDDFFFSDASLESRNKCVTITADKPKGEYPNTIILDFGEGCTGKNGHTREGKIIIEIDGPLNEVGSTRMVTFDEYAVNGISISGSKILTHLEDDSLGNPVFERSASLTFEFPDGSTASLNVSHQIVQTAGADTPKRLDNAYAITGYSEVVTKDGSVVVVTITEALIKQAGCPWLVSGVRSIEKDGETWIIDYGQGNCDQFAELTMPDGSSKTIRIGRK